MLEINKENGKTTIEFKIPRVASIIIGVVSIIMGILMILEHYH